MQQHHSFRNFSCILSGLCYLCAQLGKPRGLGAGLPSAHNLSDAYCGDAGAAPAGPWAHPAKRRRCSRSNSAMSSQGELSVWRQITNPQERVLGVMCAVLSSAATAEEELRRYGGSSQGATCTMVNVAQVVCIRHSPAQCSLACPKDSFHWDVPCVHANPTEGSLAQMASTTRSRCSWTWLSWCLKRSWASRPPFVSARPRAAAARALRLAAPPCSTAAQPL